MRKIYLLWLLTISVLSSQDFNQGPYGTTPFEIAGDFTLDDLNRPPLGDINIDSMLNIQDVMMLIGFILETINFDEGIENISDISALTDKITDEDEEKYNNKENVKQSSNAI